jgi:N-acetylmuramoyl-L-alanine amidase
MKYLLFVLLFVLSLSASATEESQGADLIDLGLSENYLNLPPAEAYQRSQAVFNYFGLPLEHSNQEDLRPFQKATSLPEMQAILKIYDVDNQLKRFVRIESQAMEVFLDRDGLAKKDFDLEFSSDENSHHVSQSLLNLEAAKKNPTDLPLKNLRIALDPGHMSTHAWDIRTGKFVKDLKGVVISEGMINLQTCLVLKAELEKLGATVLVTREDHNPVTKTPLESLDLQEFGHRALRERSLEDWFQALLSKAAPGPELYKAFENNLIFKSLFKESARDNYFILREDLEARVEIMNEFNPDISLVIHYDTSDPPGNPNGVGSRSYSKVKTYVHGGLAKEEWATQEDRMHVLLHVLDPLSWNASFNLAKSVVNNMVQTLSLSHDVSGGGSSRLVAPGVFARNLFITRKMHGHAHTYVECLHYNDPSEFKSFLQKDFELEIDGKTTYFSKRLQQVAFGIRDGVVEFVKTN